MIVSDYFQHWLAGMKTELELSTFEAYTIYINVHICPYFDQLKKPLEDLTPLDVKGYITYKQSDGRKDGKPGGLSPASVRKHLNIIKQALRDAVLYGYLSHSPADPVRMRKRIDPYSNAQFISAEDAKQILEAFEGHVFYPLVYITLIYGFRRSEVIGIKRSALDFEESGLVVRHTVVHVSTVFTKDRCKTRGSRRTFPILKKVKALLEPFKELPADAYIFHREDGSPLRPDCVSRTFKRVLRRHGLSEIRFNDLRHATASILFDAGWSIPDVQHWLGHSDIKTTANIYMAYNESRKLKVGGTLEDLFL